MSNNKVYTSKEAKLVNELAREQLKHKILTDISIDLQICKLEWWEYKDYLISIRDMIDWIIKKSCK